MTPSKWLASLVGLGLLSALGAALFFFRTPAPAPEGVAPAAVVATPSVPPPAAVTTDSKAFKEGNPMQRVMELYERESQRVGKIDPDPRATQKRLEESARELRAEEIRWLGEQVMDAKNDADARFFGAYLLGLSHQAESVGVLAKIALSPVPVSKNQRLTERERALRASAVEGISLACKEFRREVGDALLDVVSQQQDEFLRDRAHRGLYACDTGKTIESQDKEALEKLRKKK